MLYRPLELFATKHAKQNAMWVKICGVRDVESARIVAAARPDAIGLNFYPHTPRYVSPAVAAEIVRELPEGVTPVGVFVNSTAEQISSVCESVGLSHVQLHGDEPARLVTELNVTVPDLEVIRAFRIGPRGLDDVAAYLEECVSLRVELFACLLDARADDLYGGTGQLAPWDAIRREYRFDDWPPLILAGGLTPDNVTAGIIAVGPEGVDTASGVESAPGVKDGDLVRRFVQAARR
jgi:phosphoribosylanthranilate isomerase